MVALVVYAWIFVKACACGDVGLNSDNGFDTLLLAEFVKLDSPVEVAVICYPEGSHAILFGQLDHAICLRESIQEGVVGVVV